MTKQLEDAIAAVSQLPETEQDAIASWILDEIADKGVADPILSQADIKSLEKLYTLREPDKVLQFMEKYPFLVSKLQSVPDNIRYYFPNSQLFLEVITDPEIVNYQQLFLLIANNLAPDEAIDRLDEFENEWWLKTEYEVRKLMGIDVEYQ